MPPHTIYLSPHYDDVCFSLGMIAKVTGGGDLINIFTDCRYSANSAILPADVALFRDREDELFAQRCRLTRHSLGLSEAPVLGLDPFDINNIKQEAELLEKELIGLLFRLLERVDSKAHLYCPLAVGLHRNHLSVFMTIVKHQAEIMKKARLFFYEDLPYASSYAARKEAIHRLHMHFSPMQTLRHAQQMEEGEMEQKLALVALYSSQHAAPITPHQFSPQEPLTPFAHEAFWEVVS